ncbi:MAG TPA: HAMP domain-containing sensor histidine kinase [Candidatus Elarobacter sp.]|nr:HAMP domain-containing sensor histidine kinase [Dongiaceae bacterium]HZW54058.1 HAMP domain-containing sensor histidine kinase [Candidatus Elarobacter sp.]
MTSLRTRIAAFYAALMVIVIALGAVTIDFALRSVLIDQAKLNIADTAEQIERSALEASTYGFLGEGPLTLALSSRPTLDHWAAGNQYIQIDTVAGQILGKSSNLGGVTFPPFEPPPGTDRAFTELHVGGERPGTMIVLNRVLRDADGRPIAVAHAGARLDIVDQLLARARNILIGVTIGAMIVIVLASYFIAGSAIDPIERLTSAIAQIGSERLDRRLRWTRRDELGRLAAAFDAMLDRLQSAFARERQFISDASHELRTPLTVINSNAQMLQRWGDRDPEIVRSSLEAIAEESGRLAGMVSGMLTLAKAEAGDAIPKEPLVLERLVDDVVAHARERAEAKGLALGSHHPESASTIVIGDAGLLRQLLNNLVDNAIKFTDRGQVEATVRRDDGRAVVEVADTGPGIDDAAADRLFDRFFRGDPSHARAVEGTGLGLAIVRSIARVHGGTVSAHARPEGGSVFSVSLPAEPESFTPGQ